MNVFLFRVRMFKYFEMGVKMNNKVLDIIKKYPYISQKKIALKLEISIGKVNKEIANLNESKYLEVKKVNNRNTQYLITNQGIKELKKIEEEKVKIAVILAAGEETEFEYPGGFIKIGDKSLIERSIEILLKEGIKKIIIVTGYKKEYYEEFSEKYNQIQLIENNEYNKKGSYFSLKKVIKIINEDFLLLDSDIIYEEKTINYMINDKRKNLILMSDEKGKKNESYVEVVNGELLKISKDSRELKDINGEMLGISKISLKAFKEIMNLEVKNCHFSYEYAISEVANNINIGVLRIDNLAWGEVDTKEDLEKIKNRIYPRLLKIKNDKNDKIIKSILYDTIKIKDEDVDLIEPFGGMTNKNYLIIINNKKYVLRIPGNGTEEMIDRVSEGVNVNLVTTIDLDKSLLYFDPDTGIKISEYINNAKTINSQTARKNSNQITKVLKKLHTSDFKFNNIFDVFLEIEKYEKLALEANAVFYQNYDEIKEKVLELRELLKSYKIELAPCHNDPVPENFIKSDDDIYLIDWEYSGMNDPMWDLAAHMLECLFSKEEEKIFIKDYFGRKITIEEEIRIKIMKICQDFLWSIWTVLKEAQGDDFGEYGIERYNRTINGLEELIGEVK